MPEGMLERVTAALADRYRIERELGRGGMATVYLAGDLRHHRPVAIKVLRPELAAALGPDRFLREIEVTAQLHHPMILPLLDSGEADGTLYYVMPFVEGESLRDRLERERQLPLEDALQITRDVAEALSYAHSRGVIHRDIKPENILLESGHAVVADFGIAKAVTEAGGEKLTETGLSIGTPAYMSPEQAEATQPVDARSDLYSLGCVLYEMLAGHAPFTGTTAHELLVRHAKDPVPPLRSARGTVPEPIEEAIEQVLAKVPADRFTTAQQFSAALAIDAARHRRRRRLVARARKIGLGTAAGAVAVAAGIWATAGRESPAPAPVDLFPVMFDSSAIAVLPFLAIGADSGSPARELALRMGDLFELKVTGEFGRRVAHPGSVREAWRDAGGSLETALPEARELELGQSLAVGALVRGTVVESDSGLTLAARMIDVATGDVRVPTVHVDGPFERRYDLVDQLIVLLLSRDAGWDPSDAPRLARYEPEAVQAYMAGGQAVGMSPEAKRYYRMALAADSNLVEAALWTYAEGENARDTVELRYALEHQDKLTERGAAYVQILAAGRFGTLRNTREELAAYEDLARRWPEWSAPWIELGTKLATWGALAGVPNSRQRARAAIERAPRQNAFSLIHLAELAFLEEDTAWARAATDDLRPYVRAGGWQGIMPAALPWRLAVLRGDTAEAERAFESMPMPSRFYVFSFAIGDGRGLAYADRIAAEVSDPQLRVRWAWARGRRAEHQDALARFPPAPHLAPIWRLWNVFQGLPEDSLARDAVRVLRQIARGESGTGPEERAMAVWWTALWDLQHGQAAGAREAIQHLETAVPYPGLFVGAARMLEVLLARLEGGDAHAALLRMDSVVRPLPEPTGHAEWWLIPVEVENLFLARELARYGELDRALAASRRRYYGGYSQFTSSIPEYLREEGRLAAILGDTTGALHAYNHYLALREDPDPPWRAQWDSVRTELNRLLRPRG